MSPTVVDLDGTPRTAPVAPGPVPTDPAGLSGSPTRPPGLRIGPADAESGAAYRDLRRRVFCQEQGLFDDDADAEDDRPGVLSLVARSPDGELLGGVRLAPSPGPAGTAWWTGSRLAVDRSSRGHRQIGTALVRAACAYVSNAGALRFDATVQPPAVPLFTRLGWHPSGSATVAGRPHVAMTWPLDRIQLLVDATKAPLGSLLGDLRPGGPGFVGDDGAPVPGTDLVAAADAIMASMVERDPEWAGWCAVLVNVNDLTAMGAHPVGLLDALAAPTPAAATAALAGLRRAAAAWDVPILGGHTQIGVPAALSVTALGRTGRPVPAGGGRAGDEVWLTADLTGGWRPGYTGTQWDSTSARAPADLRALTGSVAAMAPAAAKDVSMAGLAGTLAMLAEASGTGAALHLDRVPIPAGAGWADWLTCFPGFAMLSAVRPGGHRPVPLPPGVVSQRCGELVERPGVALVWPDGRRTGAVSGPATGLGPAGDVGG